MLSQSLSSGLIQTPRKNVFLELLVPFLIEANSEPFVQTEEVVA